MKLVVFAKKFKEKKLEELVALAHENRFDGYDLCVRDEYPVSPANAPTTLPEAVKLMRGEGLDIPMITGAGDLRFPDHGYVRPLLKAMGNSAVRLLKIGYFSFNPETQDYWEEIEKAKQALGQWERLAREYQVKICCHTHSRRNLGMNGAALAHLINEFDPDRIGAYLDAGHVVNEGAEFAVELAIVKKHLSIIAVKDVMLTRVETNGHGTKAPHWVQAGFGMVDWTAVAKDLKRTGFNGPVSIHCEFQDAEADFMSAFRREVQFFREIFAP